MGGLWARRLGAGCRALRLSALGLGGLHGRDLGRRRRSGRGCCLCRDGARRIWRRDRRRRNGGRLRLGLGDRRLQHRRQVLLQLARIGGGVELPAGALRHASKRLECLFCLGVEADDMDAQSRRGLLQRFHRGADIGFAAIEAVGDEHDVEARGRRLLGGLDQRSGNWPSQLWLEAGPEQKLARRLRGELARLGDELGLGARLALAVTGGDQAKGDAVLIGLERLPESGPHDDDLALGAKLRPHAARAVEHDDG